MSDASAAGGAADASAAALALPPFYRGRNGSSNSICSGKHKVRPGLYGRFGVEIFILIFVGVGLTTTNDDTSQRCRTQR